MSTPVDRKVVEVPVAEYRYRHEAEFAAGFLEDAGIPFRLQIDDAGGADLGLSVLRPAVLWVRAVDLEMARELVAVEEHAPELDDAIPQPSREGPRQGRSRMTALERTVSSGLGVALLGGAPLVPPGQYREVLFGLLIACGCALLAAALGGRAPGPLRGLIRTIAGSPPR